MGDARGRPRPTGARSDKQKGSFHLFSPCIAADSCQDVCTHEMLWPPAAVPSTYCSPHATKELPGPTNAAGDTAAAVGGVHSPPAPSDLQLSSLPPDAIITISYVHSFREHPSVDG